MISKNVWTNTTPPGGQVAAKIEILPTADCTRTVLTLGSYYWCTIADISIEEVLAEITAESAADQARG